MVISLGEFGATSFVARPTTSTIPTLIFRFLERPGASSFGMAMALAVILTAITAVIVMWLDRFEAGDIGGF
jgi:thiamine transport system permease protein